MSVRENRLSDPAKVQPSDYRSMLGERGCGWVVEVDGRIVGFGVVDRLAGNVWELHDTMVQWAIAEGVTKLWLTTAPGTRAEGFYRMAGWRYAGPEPSGEARYEMPMELGSGAKKIGAPGLVAQSPDDCA
jgi:hypothetical protein